MNGSNGSKNKDTKSYKINEITLSQDASYFSVCTNKGIIIINSNTYELYSACILGEVSHSCFIPQSNIAIFSGSANNQEYGSKALVFYDVKKDEMIYYTELEEEITKLSIVGTFLFVIFDKKLLLYSSSDFPNKIQETTSVYLSNSNKTFQIWETPKTEKEEEKVSFSFLCNKGTQVNIISYYPGDLQKEKFETLKVDFTTIQNMFYIKEYKFLLIVEENGKNFFGYDVNTLTKKYVFYRGKRDAQITSATGLKDNYIAVSNSVFTIHLFSLNNGSGISGYLYSFVVGTTINSSIKIHFQDFVQKEERLFFDKYFVENGCILLNDEKCLKVIGYNGCAYDLEINFSKGTFIVDKRMKFVDEDEDILLTSKSNL